MSNFIKLLLLQLLLLLLLQLHI